MSTPPPVAAAEDQAFQDAEATLHRKIDCRAEAKNGTQFAHDFGLEKGGQPMMTTSKARNNQTLPSAAD